MGHGDSVVTSHSTAALTGLLTAIFLSFGTAPALMGQTPPAGASSAAEPGVVAVEPAAARKRTPETSADACRPDRVSLRGGWGRTRFIVELADSDASRAQGLMNRTRMERTHGMLFVYPRPQRAAFWMRNTLIPLDMIFADAQGVVTRVHSNANPLDETVIDGGRGVQYVLEINGGLARRYGIAPGTQLRHPAIGPEPAWPCR
ncbi:hypothetical protein CLV77_1244 [Brevirhabdus pacifica]|nr:hypothetical protein CLV77_1244 [Brevirhabdus pacifica]